MQKHFYTVVRDCKLPKSIVEDRFLQDLEPKIPLTEDSYYWVYTQRIINHSTEAKLHAHVLIAKWFTIAKTSGTNPIWPLKWGGTMDKENVAHLHHGNAMPG